MSRRPAPFTPKNQPKAYGVPNTLDYRDGAFATQNGDPAAMYRMASAQPFTPFHPQPFGQPFGAQPFAGQPFAGQPFAGQPFAGQPFAGQPFGAQPFAGQPFGAQPFAGQPFGAQPEQAYGAMSQIQQELLLAQQYAAMNAPVKPKTVRTKSKSKSSSKNPVSEQISKCIEERKKTGAYA